MPFVCHPLKLNVKSKFFYSLFFVLFPFFFYFLEFLHSTYTEEFIKCVLFIIIWPILTHAKKFWHEGQYLTSHGKRRIEHRKKFIENTIVSSRAQISEVCSEATFQPILQLYLLLPKIMCVDYAKYERMSMVDFLDDGHNIQLYSIITSCLSLAWSFNSYQARSKHGALDFGVNLPGRLVLLFSCLCQISSRLFLFVLFAYCCGAGNFWPIVVAIVAHMLIMAVIHKLTRAKITINNNLQFQVGQIFYQCLINGISNLYLYNDIVALETKDKLSLNFHLKDGIQEKKLWGKQLITDTVIVVENITITIIALISLKGLPVWVPLVLVSVHTLGLLLTLLYYHQLHIWSSIITCNIEQPKHFFFVFISLLFAIHFYLFLLAQF